VESRLRSGLESTVIGGPVATLETLGKCVRMLVRALAWARVPAQACRLGAGRPVGPGVRGACFRDGQLLGRLDFLEVVAIRYY
jgi:hypothetical protein